MKVCCQICDKIIDTEEYLKGRFPYHYSVELDIEPHISTANTKVRTGYVCYDCQKKVAKLFRYDE